MLCVSICTMVLLSCSDSGTGPDPGGNNGGNNGGGSTPSVTADAGTDDNAVVGFEVVADGSGSSGSAAVNYSWSISSKPANSTATLNSNSTASPDFIPDLPGEYELTLTATSDGESDTDAVLITAIAKRLFIDANNGIDGDTDGYLSDTPLKTFNKALDIYSQNENDPFLDIDTLRVAKGLYDEGNGEDFPMDFSGNLIVKGDQNVDRNDIHILSPDVERDPAIFLGEGVTMRHLNIENGYTGGTFNGDPDAVYVKSGSSAESSYVILEDVTLRTNNREGVILSTGSTINVEVRGYEGARSVMDGKNIGVAYTNRFNTSNTRVDIRDTDVLNMGGRAAFDMDDANNLNLFVTNTTVKPGASVNSPATAFQLNTDNSSLLLDGVTVTSSDGTASGNRYQRAVDMDADQPNSNIDIINSTFQYTSLSTIELYAAIVKVTDSIIEGTNTENRPDDINYLSRDGIKHLDGSLRVRGTTFRDIFGNAIAIGGPVSPNSNNFEVDLGKDGASGDNTFQNIDGWDIDLTRGSGDVSGEIPAIGNAWSNGATPRCGADRSQPEKGEIQVSTSGNSVRWGAGSGDVCN